LLPQFTLIALVMESGFACIPLANRATSLSLLGTLVSASRIVRQAHNYA
jgi:hypothetical protein